MIVALMLTIERMVANRSSKQQMRATGNSAQVSGGASVTPSDLQTGSARPKETETQRRLRMMTNGYRADFKLSEQEVYMYVQAQASNAPSLVSAFESTRDKDYLRTAAERFPADPFVQAKILIHDAIPEDRAKWMDAFKKNAPDNALANYLAATDALKGGDTKGALAEIAAAKDKSYDEFYRESVQGLEDAYIAAGHSAAESKTLGMAEITLPQLVQLKGLSKQFADLAAQAAASGDTAAQQQLLRANWDIGEKLRSASDKVSIITELMGLAMENSSLRAWPAGVPFENRSADDVLAGNIAARNQLQTAGPFFEKWFPTAPEEEIAEYMDTIKSVGESQAMAWLKDRHPDLAQISTPHN